MSISTYYRYAAWLPMLLPLAVMAKPGFFEPNKYLGIMGQIFYLVGVVGYGIPYLLTLAVYFKTLMGNDDRTQRWIAWTFPWRMVPILLCCLLAYFLIGIVFFRSNNGIASNNEIVWKDVGSAFLQILLITSAATLVLGCLYVLVAQAILWLLVSFGLAHSTESVTPELYSDRSRFTEMSRR